MRRAGIVVDRDRDLASLLFQQVIEALAVAEGLRALGEMLVDLDVVLRQVVDQFRGLVEVLIDAVAIALQLVARRAQLGFDLFSLFYRRRKQPVRQRADQGAGGQRDQANQ